MCQQDIAVPCTLRAMSTATTHSWAGTIGCEGGPVKVVDLPWFGQWTGAFQFADLRKVDEEKAKRFADRMTTLHYWGQFTDRLPAPFAADGGHQFVHYASEGEARKKRDELRDAVKAKFPNAEVTEDEEQLHVLLPDTDEELWAELAPKSEYDAAWQAHPDEECWTHAFGKDARALFWDIEGAGCADVGVSADGGEIVLVRSWLSGEDDTEAEEEAAVRAHVSRPRKGEKPGGEVELPTGKAVLVWSPIAPFQLEGVSGLDALLALGDEGPSRLDTELIEGVGTVVRVKPGRYRVTLSSTDEEGEAAGEEATERPWSCRWCRLTWIG